ncbi:hypothetical protein WJX84_011800 [Apatococcus fuscideae]|uniref:DUF1279 domain-containing protein n=1 Tax=Apatococcus fuscideae TaxID=2026836 RepID=A0AAW1SN24_9CHLO
MSSTARIRELFKKYGYTAVGVHLGVYAATISGCYVAAERSSGLEKLLIKYGLLSDESLKADKDSKQRGWFADQMSRGGPSLLIAFICTKALLPVRAPLTLAITPPVARILRQRAAST